MKQRTIYTEMQPDVRYKKLSETKADVIVNKFVEEEVMIVDPETDIKQTMYVYMTNIFSVDPAIVTESEVNSKIDFYLDYEEEKGKTLKEKVEILEFNDKILAQANAELTSTVDSILTDVLPSLMGM